MKVLIDMNIKIAGWRKTSLIDYPGYISTVLFTQGCNFRCPYCHNPDLIPVNMKKAYMDLDYFNDVLEERAHLLDGIVITGGEPTLQPDIIEFIKEIKDRGFRVKLDTNGSNSGVINKLLQQDMVDYIAMDVKNPLAKYEKLITGSGDKNELDLTTIKNEINQSLSLIFDSDIKYELRTTVVPGMHEAEDVEAIASWIEGADKYVIQNFRPDNTYNQELQGLTRLPESTLNKFRQIAEQYIDNVQIRD